MPVIGSIGRMTQGRMTQDGDNVIVRIKMASENEWKGKP